MGRKRAAHRGGAGTAMSHGATPATTALDRAGVAYVSHVYDHDPDETDFGEEAARKLGVPAERVYKTLLAEQDGALVVGVVPVTGRLDLKALAAALGLKRVSMAPPTLAERRTGYVVGGISPIGQKTRHSTVLDSAAMGHETILVSGGRRGFDIELAPADLVAVTGATLAPIARP